MISRKSLIALALAIILLQLLLLSNSWLQATLIAEFGQVELTVAGFDAVPLASPLIGAQLALLLLNWFSASNVVRIMNVVFSIAATASGIVLFLEYENVLANKIGALVTDRTGLAGDQSSLIAELNHSYWWLGYLAVIGSSAVVMVLITLSKSEKKVKEASATYDDSTDLWDQQLPG